MINDFINISNFYNIYLLDRLIKFVKCITKFRLNILLCSNNDSSYYNIVDYSNVYMFVHVICFDKPFERVITFT